MPNQTGVSRCDVDVGWGCGSRFRIDEKYKSGIYKNSPCWWQTSQFPIHSPSVRAGGHVLPAGPESGLCPLLSVFSMPTKLNRGEVSVLSTQTLAGIQSPCCVTLASPPVSLTQSSCWTELYTLPRTHDVPSGLVQESCSPSCKLCEWVRVSSKGLQTVPVTCFSCACIILLVVLIILACLVVCVLPACLDVPCREQDF